MNHYFLIIILREYNFTPLINISVKLHVILTGITYILSSHKTLKDISALETVIRLLVQIAARPHSNSLRSLL